MKVIEEYSETQLQYWVREILWAIKAIENEGNTVTWRRIRNLINIKKSDYLLCLAELGKESIV